MSQSAAAAKEKKTADNASEPVTLKVWRTAPVIKNPRLVEAYKPGTDPRDRNNVLRVQVSDNKNFIRGLEFPARHIRDDLYECARRAPRQRGRW